MTTALTTRPALGQTPPSQTEIAGTVLLSVGLIGFSLWMLAGERRLIRQERALRGVDRSDEERSAIGMLKKRGFRKVPKAEAYTASGRLRSGCIYFPHTQVAMCGPTAR